MARFDSGTALQVSRHLNGIIGVLIEHAEKLDPREFDLWREMSAGYQAQDSWQDTKGDRTEVLIRELIERRIGTRVPTLKGMSVEGLHR